MSRFGLGPVFVWEWRRVSRQWWIYAGRSVLVGGLLAGLGAVWWVLTSRRDVSALTAMAKVGEGFFEVIVLAMLAMVLLAAPAATAGSFGMDQARGHISLMLITEATALDIVLGALAARLLTVLGGVVCLVPVLALTSHLGGIPPLALVEPAAVTAGSAVLGCTLALVLSIGARRFHEVLVATHVLLAGWVLGYPILMMIRMTTVGRLIPGSWTLWLREVNPFWLAMAPVLWPGSSPAGAVWAFLGGTLVLSGTLVALGAWRLRPAALSDQRPAHKPFGSRVVTSWGPGSMLDAYPVFWRECRLQQPSRWIGLLWGLYVAGAVLFTALAVGECAVRGVKRTDWAAPFNGFQSAVGLLLLSLITPASLAEERARGSLEVLLSTPLSSRSLVLGKWLAHYRVVPGLALLPGLVAAAHAVPSGRWLGVPLVMGTVLATGAAVTSLGIALATWVPRLDRALTLSAAASVFVTVAWVPLVFLLCQDNKALGMGLASASPLFGVGLFTSAIAGTSPASGTSLAGWSLFWLLIFGGIALVLLGATLASFDACLGRISNGAAARDLGRLRSTSSSTSNPS
ncbi:MAG TPA: ABC transporter permease subunit [Isosphaeraceae bacterium]|nr:ABC transporter permease subunit [Isosphaeraceae bacterium]